MLIVILATDTLSSYFDLHVATISSVNYQEMFQWYSPKYVKATIGELCMVCCGFVFTIVVGLPDKHSHKLSEH